MEDEIAALREERERARKDREEQRNKRRKLLLNTTQLDAPVAGSIIPSLKLIGLNNNNDPIIPNNKVSNDNNENNSNERNNINKDAGNAKEITSAKTELSYHRGRDSLPSSSSSRSQVNHTRDRRGFGEKETKSLPSSSSSSSSSPLKKETAHKRDLEGKDKPSDTTRGRDKDGRRHEAEHLHHHPLYYQHPHKSKEKEKERTSRSNIHSSTTTRRTSTTVTTTTTTTSSSSSSINTVIPKNDYCQHFVDTKQRPQNFIRDADLSDRFEEYPKLKELIQLKDELIKSRATPPMYMKADLKTFDVTTLGTKFDVILVDPPWEEYSRRDPTLLQGGERPFWTLDEIMGLKLDLIADNPSFLFLWVGSAEGLDQGRLLLRKWGFRRCEDICWLKTNKMSQDNSGNLFKGDAKQLFNHSKEHCLVGIKGTVRRNQDGHIIHANIDTDVVISEELPGSLQKPEEMYHIIEHFALGRRRLELFGLDHNIRYGWVTLGSEISSSNYAAHAYQAFFTGEAGNLLGSTAEIESLRPKSPPRNQPHARLNGNGNGHLAHSGSQRPYVSKRTQPDPYGYNYNYGGHKSSPPHHMTYYKDKPYKPPLPSSNRHFRGPYF